MDNQTTSSSGRDDDNQSIEKNILEAINQRSESDIISSSKEIKRNLEHKIVDSKDSQNSKTDGDLNANKDDDNKEPDNSSSATAFTITFEDQDVGPKKFGIRDSIRKFAPQRLINKAASRTNSKDKDEDINLDAGPTSLPSASKARDSKPFSRYNNNRYSLTSNPKSLKSNAEIPASYMINKMLILNGTQRATNELHPDDKSDTGTYIVDDEEEEEQADRAKIDQLFGVVQAAEQSILNDLAGNTDNFNRQQMARASDRSRFSRERQEHINRLARLPKRNSSPSKEDNGSTIRESRRRSRNASCDRNVKLDLNNGNKSQKKRSTSQSSKNSDSDARSTNVTKSPTTISDQPPGPEASLHQPMRFNRAFALRRARLGLGEPNIKPTDDQAELYQTHSVITKQVPAGPASQANFARGDGGRYSLRMKTYNPLDSMRISSGHNNLSNQPLYQDQEMDHANYVRHPIQRNSSLLSTATTHDYQNDRCSLSSRLSQLHMNNNRTLRRSPSDLNHGSENGSIHNYNESLNINRLHQHQSNIGPLDNLVISAISNLSFELRQSICELLVDHAKQLPVDNETRSIVEDILPQLSSETIISPTNNNYMDFEQQSAHFELSKTLRNLKKMEQMVGVINLINNQLSSRNLLLSPANSNNTTEIMQSPSGSNRSLNNQQIMKDPSITNDMTHQDERSSK